VRGGEGRERTREEEEVGEGEKEKREKERRRSNAEENRRPVTAQKGRRSTALSFPLPLSLALCNLYNIHAANRLFSITASCPAERMLP
jgi:hypothetical protein